MALCLPPKNRRIHTGWHSLTSKSLPVSYRFASTTASKPTQERKKAYSQTLRLPKTTFPLRHKDIATAEKQYRRKISDNLYRHQFNNNQGSLFVLHDGPPYANGHLHMGHALNKILKDMINRYKVIRGHRVHYVPGWDCHGLPIEQKALAAIGKSHTSLLPNQVRDEARRVALEAIEIQKHEMKDLGIMADWDGPGGTYRTLDHDFEIRQLRLLQSMIEKGFITHRLRPVYYSPSSRTALAEAELVYQDGHQSRSVFVTFPVHKYDMSPGLRKIYDAAAKKIGQQALSLAVWTTTPWSLPGNSGVAVHPEMEYAVVSSSSHGLLVIAIERVEAIQKLVGSLEVMGTLDGSQLVNTQYSHLFHPPSSLCKPSIFSASHVTSQTGTGLVHSAPAHGHEDYVAFAKAGIMPKHLRCPIDDDGRFTEEIVSFAEDDSVAFLVGQDVLGEGTDQMVELLRRKRLLLAEETIEHRYPYDWKSKKPIIIRATPQWFADIEQVKDSALKALDSLQFHPPLVLFDAYGHPLMDRETLNHVIGVLDAKGIDYWWTGSLEDFIPLFRKGQLISKGIDTLDVWFDSGSSWTMLLKDQMRSSSLPLADLYLEGSDQHRGWFQSSLLTKLIGTDDGRAPYGSVITHGFIMDEDGKKMSKSAGNGLSPMQINLPAYGSDVLRLWAASVDYTSDVSIRPSSISHACETLRRLRNTTRFLLANSSTEFKSALREIDLFILHEMSCLESVAQQSYDEYDFSKVINTTSAFSISTLSTLYFEIVKDTLYCDKEDNPTRKATIAVLRHVLERLTKIIAPIVPHLAEELYDHTENGTEDSTTWVNPAVTRDMEKLLELRPGVQQLIEHARSDRYLKKSGEAELWLNVQGNEELVKFLTIHESLLMSILGVSRVVLGQPSGHTWSISEELSIDSSTLISRPVTHQSPIDEVDCDYPEVLPLDKHIHIQTPNGSVSPIVGPISTSPRRTRKRSEEGPMTTRRREANRLAAQRFRNRKKGYQDSLEEKIKILEQENKALQVRLGGHGDSRDPSSSSHISTSHIPFPGGWAEGSHHVTFAHQNANLVSADIMDIQHDHEVRIGYLEKVNQALEDEIQHMREENRILKVEFTRWRTSARERKEEDASLSETSKEAFSHTYEHQANWPRAMYPFPSPNHLSNLPRKHSNSLASSIERESPYHVSDHREQRTPLNGLTMPLHLPPIRARSRGAFSHPSPLMSLPGLHRDSTPKE
ncbi:uncharacterized protein L203_105764 [Cryptococcus depauperatus CBS 7841]|uniref:isoleucine--tRNA ligase n=1 Tax=Cryptococcus depauperatus CBS 7841 TaxID=1295531 RepID=A0AAJ8JY04_9TREE